MKGGLACRICQLWEDTHLSPGVPTSLSRHMERCLCPQGRNPRAQNYKEGSAADWGRDMGLSPYPHLATDCDPGAMQSPAQDPTALLSLHPSLGLSEAVESFPTRPKGYSNDYEGQGHCHQGMFFILSANKCK